MIASLYVFQVSDYGWISLIGKVCAYTYGGSLGNEDGSFANDLTERYRHSLTYRRCAYHGVLTSNDLAINRATERRRNG